MAFFKMRKGGDEPAATRSQPESIEAMRKRARHRLIGAGVLVLLGVIGFPLLFDTQPRPIAVDIPIEIPDRNKVKPLAAPAQPAAAQAPAVSGPVTVASAPAKETPAPPPEKVAEAASAKPEPKAEAKPEPKPEPKPDAKVAAKSDDGAKAKALLEGKEAAAAAAEGRFVVQVGAFADATKARETRLKVEKAGLKTYTNVAETKEGKRIRVRVGPFGSKAEADKAADKIKGLDLPANILTL
ncbi:SPOR domain-containing protein [Ramlibacter sp. WS9]|uniref:SPOR domain-containing protein n=1 Tax=Ramlibacter sp. WS9 TaxID=1882741 RepID=UPI001141FEA9|nr:SPOR domain-containing protein [Ramlibacter sp. WS9]ROZ74926.1 SPOR domain-containing protein [Ramlibacter sp. WS9]